MSQTETVIELVSSTAPIERHEGVGVDTPDIGTTFPDQTSNLSPVDGGSAAWRFLFAAYVFEALMWGFPLSFGVFQNYYSSLPQFKGNRYISIVGTTASGIEYLGAPLVTPLIRRWSRYRIYMICVGWPMCIIGLIAGSYATTLGALVMTQGVLYGLGFLIFSYPITSMIDEHWVKRRGMAYGFLCTASGVSGSFIPLTLQRSLDRYGYQITLRAVAIALIVLTGPCIPLIRGRRGIQHNTTLRTDWTFLKKPLFWIYSLSNLLMGLGYFYPSLYLPSYASSIGLSRSNGALLLTLMSVAQVPGQFLMGYLSDGKLSLNTLLTISLLVAATSTLSAWGVAQTFPPLICYALLYGFFGAGYTAMWARMVTAVSEEPSASQAIFGLFCFGKGVGNVMAGPIGASLLKLSSGSNGYGHGLYKPVVIFTGICMMLSAITLFPLIVRLRR